MKHIFIGANGSIAQRHIRNLKLLRPDAEIVTVDIAGKADYDNISNVDIEGNCVYVCTPMELHIEHMNVAIYQEAHAIFIEKPLCAPSHRAEFIWRTVDRIPCVAVGYNHRFHPLFRELKSRSQDISYLHIYGTENLIGKYGPTALGTMASHSIDLALWLLGPVAQVQLEDYGSYCFIGLRHENKAASHIFASMKSSFRVATCTVLHLPVEDIEAVYRGEKTKYSPGREHYFVEPDNEMYLSEMKQWLEYIETGNIGNLCSFEDALSVQRVMAGN